MSILIWARLARPDSQLQCGICMVSLALEIRLKYVLPQLLFYETAFFSPAYLPIVDQPSLFRGSCSASVFLPLFVFSDCPLSPSILLSSQSNGAGFQ